MAPGSKGLKPARGGPRGKAPARSDAEWWHQRRNTAFELLRAGSPEADVLPKARCSRRTLARWQSDPRWQKRLAERHATVVEVTQAAELSPIEYFRQRQLEAAERLWQIATEANDVNVRARVLQQILTWCGIELAASGYNRTAEILVRIQGDGSQAYEAAKLLTAAELGIKPEANSGGV